MSFPLVVLIVLDGWGLAPPGPGNAISQGNTPNMDKFWAGFPRTQLSASGEAVGLPRGEVGNTETGHLNLGAGRIVYQDLPRINMAIADGSFFKNSAFLEAIEHARKNNSKLHLMGLLGAGGVHSSIEHLFALLRLCKEQNFSQVFVHAFTDGRDSPPNAAASYVSKLEEVMKNDGVGQIASVMGRYWAMDRDLRWERTEKAYQALTKGVGRYVASAKEAINVSYEQGITDEFINPAIIVKNGFPIALVGGGDSVIFFNFRIDRPRQLTKAFIWPNFEDTTQDILAFDPYAVKYSGKHQAVQVPKASPFERGPRIANLFFVTMTEYAKSFTEYVRIAFPPQVIGVSLGRVLADKNLRQLRLAESEKERFVAYYFSGQQELTFPGEERLIIPSPNVPTYDQKPEMSAREITRAFLEKVSGGNPRYSFILINFANPDMVGHTGNFEAAKKACSVVDECVGAIVKTVDVLDGVTIITGDHGNAEQLLTASGSPHTEHTANPVPFILVGKKFLGRGEVLQSGILADVAPTVLKLLGLPQPPDMTGRSLI